LQNFAGTLLVDGFGIVLAGFGFLNPLLVRLSTSPPSCSSSSIRCACFQADLAKLVPEPHDVAPALGVLIAIFPTYATFEPPHRTQPHTIA
jgi:hypothetical protein